MTQAAFFDLDKTILARSSGLALGRDFHRAGLISARLLLRGMAAQIVYLLMGADENRMEKMRERALALTKGWDKAKVQSIVEEVMGDVFVPIIYAEAQDLIRDHQSKGRPVYIVSSSPEEIVGPFARLLEVDGHLASRARADSDGRYTGELEFYCYGESKAAAMRDLARTESIDLDESYAYSDSATDLPMLEAVGHPVATNPDRELKRVAKERNWEVRSFTKPMTLRGRISDISPPKPAVGAGLALGLLGLGGYAWLRRRPANPDPDRFVRVRMIRERLTGSRR